MEESVVARIEEIRQGIIDGTIEVPELPDRPPIRAIETDYSVDVSVVGQECAVDGFAPLSGDVVRFDIVNPTDVVMRIGLFKIIDGIPVDDPDACKGCSPVSRASTDLRPAVSWPPGRPTP